MDRCLDRSLTGLEIRIPETNAGEFEICRKESIRSGRFIFPNFHPGDPSNGAIHGPGFWLFEWYYYDDGPFLNGCLKATRDVFGVATRRIGKINTVPGEARTSCR